MTRDGLTTELFVISDLHIGGSYAGPGQRGFRINTHVDVLTQFLEELGAYARATGGRTELVINGDFVDFLAEEVPGESRRRSFIDDQDKAAATFDAIVRRDRGLFDALRALRTAGVAVAVVLGNHDIELSLPAVRARLAETLGAERDRDLRFVFDGEAYVVGDVLIEHGNRYDGWNAIDFDRLRRFRSECSRRMRISADARFVPPAGSELVERVMNPIKQDYPFIDLLKPENDAAIPLLMALEPGFANAANGIEIARRQRDAARHAPAAAARPARPGDIAAAGAPGARVGALATLLAGQMSDDGATDLLALVQAAVTEERTTRGQIAAGAMSRVLSFVRLRSSSSYETRLKVLLGTLRVLRDDASFDRGVEAVKEYKDAAEALAGNGFRTIVFGHTHLAKDLALDGGGQYLNTGTWADLIRVPPDIVHGAPEAAAEALGRFAQAILDKRFDEYILFSPTFAHIQLDAEGRTVVASVKDYAPGAVRTR
jgi:UDP-2,3-diacylglucosamine pyrophosphatase LpxH